MSTKNYKDLGNPIDQIVPGKMNKEWLIKNHREFSIDQIAERFTLKRGTVKMWRYKLGLTREEQARYNFEVKRQVGLKIFTASTQISKGVLSVIEELQQTATTLRELIEFNKRIVEQNDGLQEKPQRLIISATDSMTRVLNSMQVVYKDMAEVYNTQALSQAILQAIATSNPEARDAIIKALRTVEVSLSNLVRSGDLQPIARREEQEARNTAELGPGVYSGLPEGSG